jgi:hypothetical protein
MFTPGDTAAGKIEGRVSTNGEKHLGEMRVFRMKRSPGRQTKSRRARGYLSADVSLLVWVTVTGLCVVRLRITSVNKTGEAITLDAPYRLPVKDAYRVKALSAQGGRLRVHASDDYIEVLFNEGTVLRPNEKHEWIISYVHPSCFKKDAKDKTGVWGNYIVRPQESYKGIPIPNHRFTCEFVFLTPRSKVWRMFKRYEVNGDRNSKKIAPTVESKTGRTVCRFKHVPLARDETFYVPLTRRTRYQRHDTFIRCAVPIVVGVIVDVIKDIPRKFMG